MTESDACRARFDSCQFDSERVNASGILRDVEPGDRLLIQANGADIEIVVTHIEWPEMRWFGVDAASHRGECMALSGDDVR